MMVSKLFDGYPPWLDISEIISRTTDKGVKDNTFSYPLRSQLLETFDITANGRDLGKENRELFLSKNYYKFRCEELLQKNELLVQDIDMVKSMAMDRLSSREKEEREIILKHQSQLDKVIIVNEQQKWKLQELQNKLTESCEKQATLQKDLMDKDAIIRATPTSLFYINACEERDKLRKNWDDKAKKFRKIKNKLVSEKEAITIGARKKEDELQKKLTESLAEFNQATINGDKKNAQLKSELDEKNQLLIDLNEKHEKLNNNNKQLTKKLTESLIGFSQTTTEMDEKYAQLKSELDEKRKCLNKLNKDHQETNNKNKELTKKLNESLTKLHNATSEMDDRNSDFNCKLAEKEKQITKLNGKYEKICNIYNENEKMVVLTKTALNEAQTMHTEEVNVLQKSNETLKAENEIIKLETNKNKYLKRKIVNLESEIITVKESLLRCSSHHKLEIEDLKMEYNNKVKEIEMKITSNSNIIERKTIYLSNLREELNEHKTELNEKNKIIDALKEKDQEIDKIVFQKDAWETKCEQLDFGYEHLKQKYNDLKMEYKQMRKKMKNEVQLTKENNTRVEVELENEVKELQKEKMRLNIALEKHKSEAEEKKKEAKKLIQ